ncbi:MAG: carboxypeptidase-like regulatory domain-containing protein, partial [Planctomycetota bacterium]|nr:carboxypeptidase-like regulatory domain-containing protein [Planctomycetota bacterium]
LLELRHLGDANGIGCRIEGCFAFTATPGTVQGYVTGQRSQFLTDCRITLLQNTQEIRSAISRNWLAGTYSLLAPAGDNYQLRIAAAGWTTFTSEAFSITRDSNTVLPHTFLNRTPDTTAYRFRFPRLNQQAIQKAGDTFAARFLGFSATIEYVRITRRIGKHVISRNLDFQEQKEHAHYYDRQVLATLPGDTPPGIYDLEISIHGDQRTSICRSPRAVAVVKDHPHDPVLVTWGHLDTSGQFQAEYLQRLCAMTNLIAPDMVLSSNCVNPAYIAGAMSTLRSPYLVNFGNHQVPGHSHWYGSTVQIVPLTPKINVLNYGQPWFHGTEQAQGLLQKHPHAEFNLINGFESNAPVEFLNTNKVRLIHDAHGVGSKAMIIPGTRTQRVGKVNSISFRVVRFKDGFVESCTYDNHPTAAIPFDRHQQPPLRVDYDLQQTGHVASIVNELKMDFSQAKVRFLVPAGHVYQSSAGEIQTAALSDDKRILEVVVGVDIPRESAITVTLSPRN